MKKLVICGCSYSAVSAYEEYKNTSFSELLAKKLNWELHNFARQGCSNGGIRIQIDEAIKIKADFVIVTPTSYDRMEIPNFTKKKFSFSEFLKFFKKDHGAIRDMLLPDNNSSYSSFKSYDKDAGLNNINYGNNDSNLIVETMHSLAENWPHNYRRLFQVPEEVQQALSMYIIHIYDASWKKQCDQWIIRDGLVQLRANQIPFIVNPGFALYSNLEDMRSLLSNVLEDKYMLDDESKNPHNIFVSYPPPGSSPENPYGTNDPGYHTSLLGQQVMSDYFYDIIKTRWGL